DQLGELIIAPEEKSMKTEEFVRDIESLFNSEISPYLYEQIVIFQQTVDPAKETLETTAKEMGELDGFVFINSSEELNKRLISSMDTTSSLEKVPSAFSLFEHYVDSPGKSNQHSLKHMADLLTSCFLNNHPASGTKMITSYQFNGEGAKSLAMHAWCLTYTIEPQSIRLTQWTVIIVKRELKWPPPSSHIVNGAKMALILKPYSVCLDCYNCGNTLPAVPIIKAKDCMVFWDMATIFWCAGSMESFTLEYCRQHSPEGEGPRSFASIKKPELKVILEPNVNYFFYVRAANTFGTSEQSEAALISTKGIQFRLLSDTAHITLQISPDATVIHLPEKAEFTG
ncbi:unnamed protein product, partial [Bubo scandiacus]